MFHKSYRVKTSTTIKGSDRKKLKSSIETQYPSLSSDDLKAIVSSKNELTQTKAVVHSGAIVMIYNSGSNPIFFSVENRLFPTVYTLWKYPNLVPVLTTLLNVFPKLTNGADLMAPGVYFGSDYDNDFRDLKRNEVCSVRLEDKLAPIAIGLSAMSFDEIISEGRKGKALLIYHCYKDLLWSSGDQSLPPSNSVPVPVEKEEAIDLGAVGEPNDGALATALEEIGIGGIEESENVDDIPVSSHKEYTMDGIIEHCFLYALKIHGKKISLPILTSIFYRTYVLSLCPSELNLDIKKTTFKKLSVFLKSKCSSGLIVVKELSKGVDSIVEIHSEHESILSFIPDPLFKEHFKQQKTEEHAEAPKVQENYQFPTIVEMYAVSAQVKLFFERMKYRKGDAITANKARDVLREYVKANALQSESNPRMITLDPILSQCLLKKNDTRTSLAWEEMHDILISHMSPAYTITFENEEPKLKKGCVVPIDISVATRTGNKKVTLVSHLENFAIDPKVFAHHVQVSVAASTSVSPTNTKGVQVLIQGNQLKYLQTLLFDLYKIPKKYVTGLDNISGKKKK